MHPQNCDRRIIGLAPSGKLIHRCEDRVDQVVSALCGVFDRCPSEAFDPPLVACRIYRLSHSVRLGEDQMARIELDSAFSVS
jgi:hypothetical protein